MPFWISGNKTSNNQMQNSRLSKLYRSIVGNVRPSPQDAGSHHPSLSPFYIHHRIAFMVYQTTYQGTKVANVDSKQNTGGKLTVSRRGSVTQESSRSRPSIVMRDARSETFIATHERSKLSVEMGPASFNRKDRGKKKAAQTSLTITHFHKNHMKLRQINTDKCLPVGDFLIPIIDQNDVKYLKNRTNANVVVGHGRYGEVSLVRYMDDLCVAKKLSDAVSFRDFEMEIEMMAILNYTNATPKLIGVVEKKRKSSNKTTKAGGGVNKDDFKGDLLIEFAGDRFTAHTYTLEWLLNHAPSELDEAWWMEFCIKLCIKGAAIHSSNVLHCDIKTDNILLYPAPSYKFNPYFIDLGLSQDATRHTFGITLEGIDPGKYQDDHPFIAPELVRGGSFSMQSDIYAVAKVIEYIATGCKSKPLAQLAESVLTTPESEKRPPLAELSNRITALLKNSKWYAEEQRLRSGTYVIGTRRKAVEKIRTARERKKNVYSVGKAAVKRVRHISN